MHPFTGLATREDGAIKICCRSAPIGDIKDNTLEDQGVQSLLLLYDAVVNSVHPDLLV